MTPIHSRALQSCCRILVVQAEGGDTADMARILRTDGHDVRESTSAANALSELASNGADLVIVDYELPDFDGLELSARLRVLYPQMIRVLLTGKTSFEVARDAINRGGVFRLWTKPWDVMQLRIDVAMALEEARKMQSLSIHAGPY
jgi:DNA-binding NtrC family response regulator